MAFPNANSNFNKLLIFIILISLSSSDITQPRFLQFTNNYYLENDTNITSNQTSTLKTIKEDPGSYLLVWFFIFFFMGLYIVCNMGKYKEIIANRKDDVWKFMFFANNGIFVASGVNIFNIKNLIIDSSPFGLSALVCLIGCAYYIYKYCQICNMKMASQYFDCDKLSELFNIPCFIFSLVGLTDPCCRSESYSVTTYTDGHTESTYCCHCMWNCIIYVIKRFAVFFSIISYYIFLIFYLYFWFIAKLIFMCIYDTTGQTTVNDDINKNNKNNNNNNNYNNNSNNNNNDNNNNDKNRPNNIHNINYSGEIMINNGHKIIITHNININNIHKIKNPSSNNKLNFNNLGTQRIQNNETNRNDDNIKNNNDNTQRSQSLPSEGEIYKPTPNDNNQNNDIDKNNINNYINNNDKENNDINDYQSEESKNNNMEEAPAPNFEKIN